MKIRWDGTQKSTKRLLIIIKIVNLILDRNAIRLLNINDEVCILLWIRGKRYMVVRAGEWVRFNRGVFSREDRKIKEKEDEQ